MGKWKELIRGVSGNKGMAVGKVRIINGDENKLAQIQVGEILVADKLEPSPKGMAVEEYDKHLKKAAAIVQNVGGVTSHGNIIAIKEGKPSVAGTIGVSGEEATKILKDGMLIKVDGLAGYVDSVDKLGKPYKKPVGVISEWIPDHPGDLPPESSQAPTGLGMGGGQQAPVQKMAMGDLLKKYGIKPKGQ